MEEEPTDPHEQQLLAVFKSCLTGEQNKLDKKGLLVLCSKLELEEDHKDAIIELLEMDVDDKSITFFEFKDSFLALLGKSQDRLTNRLDKDNNDESQALNRKNNKLRTRFNDQPAEMKQPEVMNCLQLQTGLQETWSNQNSLTIEDVNSFCNRETTLSKHTIKLIFEKLDIDCDGLISFNEFLHFCQSANNKLHEQFSINWSTYLHKGHIKNNCCKDFLHSQPGYTLRSVIIELWEVAGVSEANSLLLGLGFDTQTINFIDLSNALSAELKLRDVSPTGVIGEYVRLLKGALILYQEEVRNLNTAMEHLCCERDKLRTDISEANERANILAQDVDEHQTRMDKLQHEQLRHLEHRQIEALKDLNNQLHLEREKSTSTLKKLEEQLQTSQHEEQRIRVELATLLREMKLLETENQNQTEEITKLEMCNDQLSTQLSELAAVHDQVESIEARENDQLAGLMAHINSLEAEIKRLRDHNDEITSELESLKHRDNDTKNILSSVDIRSTISDENDGVASIPTTEVSDTEDEEKHQTRNCNHSNVNILNTGTRNKIILDENNKEKNINKLTDIIQEFRNFLTQAKCCTECTQFRNEVSSLISELELYKSGAPSSSISTSYMRRRKHRKNLANELEAEYKHSEQRTESCRDLLLNKNEKLKNFKRMSSSDDTFHDILDDNIDHLDNKIISKHKLCGLRDYAAHNQLDKDKENKKQLIINNFDTSGQNLEEKDLLKEEKLKHATEKKQLLDRCNELEKSLEMLKSEYEQCEDYWAAKLEEERQIFEQEQKISDEKFTELINKMSEYEEQFNTNDKCRNDGRLSPIEERVNLEQQYNDLQDEFDRWRAEAQEEIIKREKEIQELKRKLNSEKYLSLKDISVQFPDEHMKSMYPQLYSALCSSTKSTGKSDSTISMWDHMELLQRCSRCHTKTNVKNNCNCQVNTQEYHQQKRDYKFRRSEGKGRHYHHQKRIDLDTECSDLIKQKEKLKHEILKLQSLKTISSNNMYPLLGNEEKNMFSTLYAKLYAQEHKQKYMQMIYYNRQKDNDRILQGMCKQHLLESSDLRYVIRITEEKLNQQIKLNKEQNDKLTKADFLTKELYVENAQLSETIKRLEQHCQILTQNRIESASA